MSGPGPRDDRHENSLAFEHWAWFSKGYHSVVLSLGWVYVTVIGRDVFMSDAFFCIVFC